MVELPKPSVPEVCGESGMIDTCEARTLCLSVSDGTQRSVYECLTASPSKPSVSWYWNPSRYFPVSRIASLRLANHEAVVNVVSDIHHRLD